MAGKTFTISSHPILRNEIKILDFAHLYELMYEKILGTLERTTYQQLRRWNEPSDHQGLDVILQSTSW